MLYASYPDRKKWVWGGREGSSSISDAEQLLCLLLPVHEIDTFAREDAERVH